MCVAGLNVTVASCGHRWYELVRACRPGANLSQCAERLQLEGWEVRNAGCPWCDGDDSDLAQSTHRLIGSRPSPFPGSFSIPTSPEPAVTRTDRSGSGSTLSALSRRNSSSSTEADSAVRHREQNNRLHIYLNQSPHKILPSAYKYYPSIDARLLPTTSDDLVSSQGFDTSFSMNGARRRDSITAIKRGWRRSLQLGRGLFTP